MQWIRCHWQAVLGVALLVLPPAWKWVRQALSVLGDVDLIVERTREPGWVKPVIELALDPPGWLLLIFALSGLSIILWDVFYKPRIEHGSESSPENFVAQGQKDRRVAETKTKTNTGAALHSPYRQFPGYVSWDRFDDLALFQAACLWAGVEPTNPVPTGEPTARLEMLKRAIWNEELEADFDKMTYSIMRINKALSPKQIDRNTISDGVHVSRSSLLKFAEKMDENPLFLFPEERK